MDFFSNLMMNYPHYDKWEFNIVDEFDGRGRALFKTDSISIMNEIRLCDTYEERILHLDSLRSMVKKYLSSNLNLAA